MTDTHRETLSAGMDGELTQEELRFLLRRLDHDSALQQAWSRYHVARDGLRRQLPPPVSEGFSARVLLAIEQEAAVVVGSGRRRHWLASMECRHRRGEGSAARRRCDRDFGRSGVPAHVLRTSRESPARSPPPLPARASFLARGGGSAARSGPSPASSASSRNGEPGSISASMRSRASSLPRSRCFCRADSGPPIRAALRRAYRSSSSLR